jgi:tetratricopeptide (TPR) repeat protein
MARVHLGNALCAKGAIQEGLTHLSDAVNLDPANVAVRHNLAITLARLKRHDQAIPHFLRILRSDPRNTGALTALAASYAETNQMDKALSRLEEVLRIAQSTGNQRLAGEIARQIERYSQRPQR